jgi:hypothetical protein
MEALFGARMIDANPKDVVSIKVVAPFGNLKPGDTFHYAVPSPGPRSWGAILEVRGGTVIAVDQDGRPALVANKVGSGHTLLSAYPIETYLASSPAVFEKPEQSHRIYQAFIAWSGFTPQFYTDQPSVEVLSLSGNSRGYAILTNHSDAKQVVTVTTPQPLRSVSRVTSEGKAEVELSKTKFKVDLNPYDGAVVEWNK